MYIEQNKIEITQNSLNIWNFKTIENGYIHKITQRFLVSCFDYFEQMKMFTSNKTWWIQSRKDVLVRNSPVRYWNRKKKKPAKEKTSTQKIDANSLSLFMFLCIKWTDDFLCHTLVEFFHPSLLHTQSYWNKRKTNFTFHTHILTNGESPVFKTNNNNNNKMRRKKKQIWQTLPTKETLAYAFIECS